MARLVFGMSQSLDGYVDHGAFVPGPSLFRHFTEEAQVRVGCVYGRRMCEGMRYWDGDHPEWDVEEQAFATAWRNQPKWVVSRSLSPAGSNATLVSDDLAVTIAELKADRDGEIGVAGQDLARSLAEVGLIDEYRIYLHHVVPGRGKPYLASARPALHLVVHEPTAEDVVVGARTPVTPHAPNRCRSCRNVRVRSAVDAARLSPATEPSAAIARASASPPGLVPWSRRHVGTRSWRGSGSAPPGHLSTSGGGWP